MAGVQDVVVLVGCCVLGTWLTDLVRDASHRSDPGFEYHHGDADHTLLDLGRTEGVKRTLTVVGPGLKVMNAIRAQTVRVVAAIDDTVDSVRFVQKTRQMDFTQAMREQTRYAAGHCLLRDNGAVHLVMRNTQGLARDVIDSVLAHLGYMLTPEHKAALHEAFGGAPDAAWTLEQALEKTVAGYASLATMAADVPAAQAVIVREALSPLVRSALSPDFGPVIWNRSVFLFADGDQVNATAPPVADITGAARVIFFGPYFYLPEGRLTVRVLIAFSKEVRGTSFMLKLLCFDSPVAILTLKPDDSGAFEGSFTISHQHPERWLEIQFLSVEGAIEGHVALGRMEFRRAPPPEAPRPSPEPVTEARLRPGRLLKPKRAAG